MDKLSERQAKKLAATLALGQDTGMRICLQWKDTEVTVFSWDAAAALTGYAASTLRVYHSRNLLDDKPMLAKHPRTGESEDCQITVMSPPMRGRPVESPKSKLLRAKQLATAYAKLKVLDAQREIVLAKIQYLENVDERPDAERSGEAGEALAGA
jgi:hypothetical protein